MQVVDTSVPVGVAAQAAALAEEVRQAQWLLGEHPWDMSIVIDDGWEAPPIPEPVAETGAAEEEAAPEPAPPAVRPPGPGAELAAAVTELLGSGSQASVRCTSAWVAPEPPEGEEGEGQTACPAASVLGIENSAAYTAEPPEPTEGEEGAEPPPEPVLVVLPSFDGANHVAQVGDLVASVADGAQCASGVASSSENRLVKALRSLLVPDAAHVVLGAPAAFKVSVIKAAIEAGLSAARCIELGTPSFAARVFVAKTSNPHCAQNWS